jgi:hypothetical protein
LISDLVAVNYRGQALSTMAGLQRFGNFLGPLSTGYIVYEFGYATAFTLIALLAGATYLLLITRSKPAEMPTEPLKQVATAPQNDRPLPGRTVPAGPHPIWQMLRDHRRILLTGGTVVFLLTLIRAARTLLLPLWGISLGLNAAEIGAIVGLAAGLDHGPAGTAASWDELFGSLERWLGSFVFYDHAVNLCLRSLRRWPG